MPSRPCLPIGDAAFAGAFGVVGFGAVLVEQEQGAARRRRRVPWARPRRRCGPGRLRSASRVAASTKPGQFVDRLADHLDVLGVDRPRACAAAVAGKHRCQRFAGQRRAAAQQGGLGQPAAGLAGRDPPPDRQHVFQDLAPISCGVVSACSRASTRWLLGGQLAGQGFQLVERPRAVRGGQQVDVAGGQRVVRGTQSPRSRPVRPSQTYFEHTFDHRQNRIHRPRRRRIRFSRNSRPSPGSQSRSARALRAASSSASRAATLAACWERASSMTASIGVERSSCSSLAARETAAAATARSRAR